MKDGFFVNILFQDSYGNNSSLVLSRDCPLQLALIYFLTDSDNVDYLLQLLKGNKDSSTKESILFITSRYFS